MSPPCARARRAEPARPLPVHGRRTPPLGRSRYPCGMPCCVASTRMPDAACCQFVPRRTYSSAVRRPAAARRHSRWHRRAMRCRRVPTVVPVGPPTSCSMTCDASPSCASTPSVRVVEPGEGDPGAAHVPSGAARRVAAGCRPGRAARSGDPHLGAAAGGDDGRDAGCRRGRPRSPRSAWRPATRRRHPRRCRRSGTRSAPTGCARGTLHTMSKGSIVGSTSPARASSRSDAPFGRLARDGAVGQPQGAQSRSAVTWIDTGETFSMTSLSPGIGSSSSPTRNPGRPR